MSSTSPAMASKSSPSRISALQSPRPPSPIEEDLTASMLDTEHAVHQFSSENRRMDKGKGRQRDDPVEYEAVEELLDGEEPERPTYPPTNDNAETRRIEETLRRWEVAERQRRKAARESSSSSQAPSIMGNVAQRASLLWSGRKPQNPPRSSTGLGRHAVLSSRESVDGVPLDDIHDASTIGNDDDNPFDSPTETIGPFSVSTELQDSPVMNPSSEPPTPPISKNLPDRPDLEPSLTTRQPPPPQPLGLPAPVAPPPRVDIPNSDQPPHLTPPLSVRPSSPVEEDVKETRWWHDWLCGCSEGPDRGGDSQAGRTNPFE